MRLLLPAVAVLAVFAAALGALFRWSVLEFVPGSLQTGGYTLANFRAVMAPQYLGAIRDTLVLSALTTGLTLVCAYPVAYALARTPSRRVRSLLLVLTLAPFFTGAIVRTYAWVLVLGNTVVTWPWPMLFTERGVLVGLVHFSMPTMILILAAALSHIDPAYERAAASLGARPARVFLRVTLPLSMPGIVSGGLIVFAWTLSAFPTPGDARRRQGEDDRQRGARPRAGLVQLAGGGGLRHARARPHAGAARRHGPRGRAAGDVMLRAAVVLLVGFMTLPTVVVIAVSFNPTAILSFPPAGFSLRWYENVLTYPQFQRAAWNSVIVTGGAVALALPIGTLAALALERGNLRGRSVWAALLLSPLVVPGVAAGLGFLILAAALGLLRSRAVLVTAHVALVLPFVVRSVWVSVRNLDPALERAAASLGATPWRVFRRVTLPLLRPGLFAGLLFAVVVSVNEFVVSLFISNRVTETLPVAMFSYVVNYTDPSIAALSSLFIGATFLAVWLADRYLDLSRVFLRH